MRRLLHVPIRHTQTDLGSLAEAHASASRQARGERAARAHARSIEQEWHKLTRAIPFLPLDWPRVRLYQDGLPVCGRELDIVRDLASQGSANHRLLQRLVERGARLMGTEDPALLLAELERARSAVAGQPVDAGVEILHRRDAYIAQRIGQTLASDEVGLLFLGAAHDLAPHLPADVSLQPWTSAR